MVRRIVVPKRVPGRATAVPRWTRPAAVPSARSHQQQPHRIKLHGDIGDGRDGQTTSVTAGPAPPPPETPSMLHGLTEQFQGQIGEWHATATEDQKRQALASYKRLMEDETTLVVARQLEMMEMLIGFDTESKYAIYNQHHQHLGYLIEQNNFGKSILRNVLKQSRPFTAYLFDTNGLPLLKIQRPFGIINTKLFVTDSQDRQVGEIHQKWHLWRRRYELFEGQNQFGNIDAPLLSWDFPVMDENGQQKGMITRNFSGLLREMFTDTGNYVCERDAQLTAGARSVLFATSVAIDFDYFSRSRGGLMSPGLFGGHGWWPFGGGYGGEGGGGETGDVGDSGGAAQNPPGGYGSAGDAAGGGGWFGPSSSDGDQPTESSDDGKPWWGEISDTLFGDDE